MSITLRPFHPEDAEALHILHTAAIREVCARDYAPEVISVWLATRLPEIYQRSIAKGHTYHVATNVGGTPVGFCSWKGTELSGLYVHPAHHGQRIGTILIRAAEATAHAAGTPLTYVESTLNAQKFYENHGYIKIGTGLSTIGGKETHIPHIAMRKKPATI